MRRQFMGGLLAGTLILGCGSNGPQNPDVAIASRPDTAIFAVDTSVAPAGPGVDAGAACDEDALGTNACIMNPPGPAQGGGTAVARQKPAPYQTCKP